MMEAHIHSDNHLRKQCACMQREAQPTAWQLLLDCLDDFGCYSLAHAMLQMTAHMKPVIAVIPPFTILCQQGFLSLTCHAVHPLRLLNSSSNSTIFSYSTVFSNSTMFSSRTMSLQVLGAAISQARPDWLHCVPVP